MEEDDRPVSNMPYDEYVNVTDGEDVPTSGTEAESPGEGGTPRGMYGTDDDDDDDEEVMHGNVPRFETGFSQENIAPPKIGMVPSRDPETTDDDADIGGPGPTVASANNSSAYYNPADFEHLTVSQEIKDLFQYISRYTPQQVELEHKLKPFIPEYIPAVGDIDAFISVPRPDGIDDKLGLAHVDEPCAKQSDPTVLALQIRALTKQITTATVEVASVQEAEKDPRAVDNWIMNISELHRQKPPPSVHYSKNMPDIDSLMQEWPPEMEELLTRVNIPKMDLDTDLGDYVDVICAVMDIPVYQNKIHSLHVLFTLYNEFKSSQYFQRAKANQ